MKTKLALLFLFPTIISFGQLPDFFESANTFFSNYCSDGKVDYTAVQSDKLLPQLVTHIETEKIPSGKEKAYLINVYNLLVINKISKQYPVSSPMDDAGFFTSKTEVIAGDKIALNDIENNLLRKQFNDPRLHFVLVCGAIGCPPIVNYAYLPELLDDQLTDQTKKALNNSSFVYQSDSESTIYLSEIFNWYSSDFGKNNSEIIAYINAFREEKFNTDYKTKFYTYNWSLNAQKIKESKTLVQSPPSINDNIQLYNAGSLLGKGKMDITLFNTMYTEQKQNWLGQSFSGYRSTFVTHLLQYTIGVSKNRRINLGVDLNFRSSAKSSDSSFSSVKNAFAYKNNDSTRVGLTSVGLRVKLQPFKSVSNFSIQSTLYSPTIKHPEGLNHPTEQNLYWADWNRITWWNQLFYSKNFGKFQLFTELDFLFRFKVHESQIGMLDIPGSVFLSYFPTDKITVYGMTQHVHRYTNNINPQDPVVTDWVVPANYTASGIGFKYQILSNLNIELLYTNFWRGRNTGLGNTFNLGLKFLTR